MVGDIIDTEDAVRVIMGVLNTLDEKAVEKWVEENKCDCCSNCKRKW